MIARVEALGKCIEWGTLPNAYFNCLQKCAKSKFQVFFHRVRDIVSGGVACERGTRNVIVPALLNQIRQIARFDRRLLVLRCRYRRPQARLKYRNSGLRLPSVEESPNRQKEDQGAEPL
jgi:hypothetical protein